ncbi:MAG: class I SAM-dependent methyltransferase [Chitinophagaceae bacterium]
MNNLIHYTNCPVCNSTDIKNIFRVKDYTVSGELFQIAECDACSLRFTQDVPGEAFIAPYYKSEDYISHTNTAKGFINRLYHSVRRKTLKKKRKLVQRATKLETGDVLDVGSGIGSFVNEMKEHGWLVTGLEPDSDARKIAKETYKLDLADIKQLYQLEANSFDAITLWHVLEHVHELQACITQLKNLLKEKGKIFIAVPNYTATDAKMYKEYWAAYDVPRHLYHFSPRSMQVLMEKHGMTITKYQPMWYDSFYISMLSSKYKNSKTNLVAAFWNGLRSNITAMSNSKKCSSVIYIISK